MATLYDTSNTTCMGRKIARQMGMQAMSSNDVRNYCIQHRLAHKCGPGTRYDEDELVCVPKASMCPQNYSLDKRSGRCVQTGQESHQVKTVCGPGTILDQETNSCRVDCDSESTWNERTRQCERPCREDSIEHTICGPKDKEISSCAFK